MSKQGYEANYSGNFLESAIEREFAARKVHVKSSSDDEGIPDLFATRLLLKNAPYKSIYGCQSRSEFLYAHYPLVSCRVECRYQESAGSVDEKFPYLLMNAHFAMPEPNVWIVVEGGGARPQAIQWLVKEAGKITDKNIRILCGVVEAKKAIKDLVENGIA